MIGASLQANLSNDAQVFGTGGRCNLTGGIYFPTGCHIELNDSGRKSEERRGIGQKVWSRFSRGVPQGRDKRWRKHSIREGYACEARAVHQSLLSGSTECSEMSLNDTLEVLEIMDEIRNQWA